MTTKFYKCETCGNVVIKLVDVGVPVVCCGKKMEELVPNTVDASNEKHVPVVTWIDNNTIKVEVGSVAHPMEAGHHIEIKHYSNLNFKKFVNHYRVLHAQELFKSNRSLKVTQLYMMSGFKNKATFATAFHLEVGENPKEWCDYIRSKNK